MTLLDSRLILGSLFVPIEVIGSLGEFRQSGKLQVIRICNRKFLVDAAEGANEVSSEFVVCSLIDAFRKSALAITRTFVQSIILVLGLCLADTKTSSNISRSFMGPSVTVDRLTLSCSSSSNSVSLRTSQRLRASSVRVGQRNGFVAKTLGHSYLPTGIWQNLFV